MLIYQATVAAILVLLLLNTLVNLRLLRRVGVLTPQRAGHVPPLRPAWRGGAGTGNAEVRGGRGVGNRAPRHQRRGGPRRYTAGRGRLDDAPLVSILVPARDEERGIGRCVESLARQDYPHCEVLVLDDRSDDQTAAIVSNLAARYPQVRLLRGEPLPPGWHGKAFACAQLAREARGEWLLFADADTVHAPHCVSSVLAVAQRRNAGLLTMIPRLVAGSFGEALLLPTIPLTFACVLPLGLVTNLPWPVIAGAFGPFMLFRREVYERLGGHAAVRADIVEDMQLSRLVKRHGGRVMWIDGTELVAVRLYHGLGEAWRGLAKSAFAATDYSLLGLLIGMPLCALFLLAPYGFLAAALIGGHVGSVALFWLPLCQVAAVLTSYALLLRRFGLPLTLLAFHAATIAAIILYTVCSAYQSTFGGGVVWKGRSYDFAARRRPSPGAPADDPALRGAPPQSLPARAALRWVTGTPRRLRLANELPVARLLLAALLVVLGWRAGVAGLRLAVLLPLVGWTLALLEHAHAHHHDLSVGRIGPAADLAQGAAALAYPLLSGLIPVGLALLAAAMCALAFRVFAWRTAAGIISALLGGLLLLVAGASTPTLDALPLLWCVMVLVLARRPIAQAVAPWIHRLRP